MFKNGMRPVHPGEVLLQDYIKPMSISVRDVTMALHVPYSRLSEITKGKRGVSADTTLRLERYIGVPTIHANSICSLAHFLPPGSCS